MGTQSSLGSSASFNNVLSPQEKTTAMHLRQRDPNHDQIQAVCTTSPECALMIRALLPTGAASESISWAFIGSSTMWRTFGQIRRVHGVDRRWHGHRGTSGRCDLHKFFNVKPAANWSLPDIGKEGPHLFGKDHPGCTDCSGCNAWRSGETSPSVEYIPIEFARDVEIQTQSTRTTQETVSRYLAHRPRDICVVSAGIHDMAIPKITDEQFLLNVAFYLQQLLGGCAHIVWVTMSSVKGNPKHPQMNDRIRRWNEGLIRHGFIAILHYAYVKRGTSARHRTVAPRARRAPTESP